MIGCLDDFFVGIGDINSTFLPKIEHVVPELPPDALITATQSTDSANAGEEEEGDAGDVEEVPPSQLSDATPPPSSSPEDSSTDAGSPELTEDEIFTRNTMALDAQMEERPLAKKQEELLEGASSEESPTPESATNGEAVTTNGVTSQPDAVKSPKPARKALLKNDDVELTRVQKVLLFPLLPVTLITHHSYPQLLDEVHTSFYDAYDARDRNAKPDSRKSKRKQEPHRPYDVRVSTSPPMRLLYAPLSVLIRYGVFPLVVYHSTDKISYTGWCTFTLLQRYTFGYPPRVNRYLEDRHGVWRTLLHRAE